MNNMSYTSKRKDGAIILAGGRGERFHGQKQFVELHGKPIWQIVYEKAKQTLSQSDNLVVVGVDIPGGDTRTQSVITGLKHLKHDTERVIILEAARPLVTLEQIQCLLQDTAPSTSFVMPLVNTVITRQGGYLNRSELYDLLTPQAFDYQLLLEAYDSGKFEDLTDETRVMYEYHGIKPNLIETTDNLIKITYPKDLAIVEFMAENEQNLF